MPHAHGGSRPLLQEDVGKIVLHSKDYVKNSTDGNSTTSDWWKLNDVKNSTQGMAETAVEMFKVYRAERPWIAMSIGAGASMLVMLLVIRFGGYCWRQGPA